MLDMFLEAECIDYCIFAATNIWRLLALCLLVICTFLLANKCAKRDHRLFLFKKKVLLCAMILCCVIQLMVILVRFHLVCLGSENDFCAEGAFDSLRRTLPNLYLKHLLHEHIARKPTKTDDANVIFYLALIARERLREGSIGENDAFLQDLDARIRPAFFTKTRSNKIYYDNYHEYSNFGISVGELIGTKKGGKHKLNTFPD